MQDDKNRIDKSRVEGEGSYSGTRDYNARTRKFVESGRVKEAARKAAPRNPREASEMRQAEKVGRKRAKR